MPLLPSPHLPFFSNSSSALLTQACYLPSPWAVTQPPDWCSCPQSLALLFHLFQRLMGNYYSCTCLQDLVGIVPLHSAMRHRHSYHPHFADKESAMHGIYPRLCSCPDGEVGAPANPYLTNPKANSLSRT